MTPEEKRLENAKARLIDAATFSALLGSKNQESWKNQLLLAAMDYAETVHYVEWLRAKQAEERDKRLSETATDKQKPS